MTGSLAYRKNEAAILSGDVPEKYLRLVPYIPGDRILEIGSAEGVLTLILARKDQGDKRMVVAVERSLERHRKAEELALAWSRYPMHASPVFINGEIKDNLDILPRVDTVVAVRSIYYLGDDLDRIFAAIAKCVPNVVLCGNKNRAARYHAGTPDEPLGEMNRYASAVGMTELLERHGYKVVISVAEGDPIIVGKKHFDGAVNV